MAESPVSDFERGKKVPQDAWSREERDYVILPWKVLIFKKPGALSLNRVM